ncbi:MAG: Ig-like domain-containing protein [Nitrososphaera sp.]
MSFGDCQNAYYERRGIALKVNAVLNKRNTFHHWLVGLLPVFGILTRITIARKQIIFLLIASPLLSAVHVGSPHQSVLLSAYGQTTGQPQVGDQQEPEPDRDIVVITDEDSTVTINVLSRERNLPGSNEKDFRVTWVSSPSKGRAILNNDDTISYSPNPAKVPAGSSISDTLLYRVQQTIKGDDSATPTFIMRKATVWINQTNDVPVVFDMDYVIKTNAVVNLNLRAFDSDGDKLTYVLIPQTGGAPIFNNQTGRLTFKPSLDFQGTKQFDFVAKDNSTMSNTATVTITVTDSLTAEDLANNALQIKPIPPSSSVNHSYLSLLKGSNALSLVSLSAQPENNAFHVFGEITNTLGFAVANTTVNIKLYDKRNNMIANQTSPTLYNILLNEDRSSFDLVLQNTSSGIDASTILYYHIRISWKDPTLEGPRDNGDETSSEDIDNLNIKTKPRFLKMIIDDIFLDQCGYYHVTGKIGNLGGDDTRDVVIHAAFYNEQQQILAIAHTTVRSSGTWLPSGEFASFDIAIDSPEAISKLTYVSTSAQSDLYSAMSDSANTNSLIINNESLAKLSSLSISTDKKIYNAGESTINITGTVTNLNSEDEFLVIKVTSIQGSLLKRAIFSTSNSSTFSFPLKFFADESWHGKLFVIQATYAGQVAANTFTIIPEGVTYDDDVGKINFNNCLIEHQFSLNSGNDDQELPPLDNLLGALVVNQNTSIVFSSQFQNDLSTLQPFVLILEGIDVETGLVSFIKYENGTAMPNKTHVTEVEWTPEGSQKLLIKAFLLSGLDQPRILARVATIHIMVQ